MWVRLDGFWLRRSEIAEKNEVDHPSERVDIEQRVLVVLLD